MAALKLFQSILGPRGPTSKKHQWQPLRAPKTPWAQDFHHPPKNRCLLIQGVLWGHWGEKGRERERERERERRYVGGSRGRWACSFDWEPPCGNQSKEMSFSALFWEKTICTSMFRKWTPALSWYAKTKAQVTVFGHCVGFSLTHVLGMVHHCTHMLEKSQTSYLPECKPRPRPSLALVFLSLTICFLFGVGLLWSTWPPKINGSP